MKRLCVPAMVVAALFLGACGPMADRGDESKQLLKVEYTVRAMYEGHERTMSISPSGDLILKEELHENIRNIVSAITPDERADLVAAFRGWDKLKDSYAVDVSPQITISYGGKSVTTSRLDTAPEPFGRAKAVLDKIAIALSVAADTQSAPPGTTVPASQATTQP